MLHNIYVKNLALIDEIEVELKKGLNILTGETGAGKSIILGSINLALGGRYSSDILRSEDEDGYVELTFFVEDPEQEELLKGMDISVDDGVVILSRKMMGKRSVSKINGESIFLPAGGYIINSEKVSYAGSYGYYWSSSLVEYYYPDVAHNIEFGTSYVYVSAVGCYRFIGMPVRPVCLP